MTVGELKNIIKDLPDDALVLRKYPFYKYSFDNVDIYRAYSIISKIQNNNKTWYFSWDEPSFNDLLENGLNDVEALKADYSPSLILSFDSRYPYNKPEYIL